MDKSTVHSGCHKAQAVSAYFFISCVEMTASLLSSIIYASVEAAAYNVQPGQFISSYVNATL